MKRRLAWFGRRFLRVRVWVRGVIWDRNRISLRHGVTSVAWVRAGQECQLLLGSLAFYVSHKMGKESIPVTQKKRGRGRPATGQDPTLTVRLPMDLRSAIETWAKQQKDTPSRSEAIRRLIEIALTTKSKRHSNRGER